MFLRGRLEVVTYYKWIHLKTCKIVSCGIRLCFQQQEGAAGVNSVSNNRRKSYWHKTSFPTTGKVASLVPNNSER